MKSKLILLFLFLLVAQSSLGQKMLSISGVVKDEKNLTVPGATVFLTGTKSITACNNDGRFRLENVAQGSYEIIVKMVGYLPYVKPIKLSSEPLVMAIQLKPDNFLLKEVKIHPDYDRLKHLAIFTKEFLGQTYNAAACKIINPDVLYFTYDKKAKLLTATADDILVIQNNALGYKIKYVLTDFQFNANNNIVSYQGYPSFTEIQGTPKQEALWAKNRKIAYLGSINHFIRSIYSGRVYKEGFNVYKLMNRPMMGIQPDSGAKQILLVQEPVDFDSLVTVKEKDLKSLTYTDCLYVIYKKEKEPENYVGLELNITKTPTADTAHGGQVSLVYLLDKDVDIDGQGLYTPTNGLFFEGYWAWEKNADLMPLEYTAEDDSKD